MAYDISLLTMAKALAAHSGARQTVVSENIANADTRDYSARDVAPFASVYRGPGVGGDGASGGARRSDAAFAPSATRPGHAGYAGGDAAYVSTEAEPIAKLGAQSPNGNSVSLEDQMARGVKAALDQEMALAVLKSSMNLLKASIGRGR